MHQARAHGAIKVGHLDETKLLMEVGADVNHAIEADGMTPLMTAGKVYLAQPPLYRIDIGKETHWALDDAQKAQILERHAKGRGTPEITRFKGLGEMMPKVLWETTLNPKTRRLLRVEVADHIMTDRVINELMGKDASARFRFIMERAEDIEEIDV